MNFSYLIKSNLFPRPLSLIKEQIGPALKDVEKKTALIAVMIFGLVITCGYCVYNFYESKKAKAQDKNHLPAINADGIKEIQTQTDKLLKTYLPVIEEESKEGLFVDVLNVGGYSLNGKNVLLPPASKPVKYVNDGKFEESLEVFKKDSLINDKKKIELQFKDLTTEQAINEGNFLKLALNFANQNHAGGDPGFHKDPDTGLFVYDCPSAKAQEESLCQRSDLFVSLTQLSHVVKGGRSFYNEEFDSRKMAYGSLNHLFGVQENDDIYHTLYLEQPKPVVYVTSAANYYGGQKVDCSKGSEVYLDAKQRIETHMLAAAFYSQELIKQDASNSQPIELILGAYGCGAFAPVNGNEYRQMIAEIYLELLPKFQGIFDVVTFAVPTFGETNLKDPAVANYHVFKTTLGL